MSDLLLEGRTIHKSYKMGHENLRVLRGASIKVNRGEFLAIMGSSGSGKSTLLHILGALDTPDRGSVHYGGHDVFNMSAAWRRGYSNRDVGFIFQFYHLLPELNVLENVLMARMISHSGFSWFGQRSAARRDAEALVERIGLRDRLRHRPRELSGGERQRVAIARALVNGPALLLADEPTGNLDEKIGGGILDLLFELNEGGQAIVMVTHDPRVASRAHRRVHLTDGVIREAVKEQVRRPAGMSTT